MAKARGSYTHSYLRQRRAMLRYMDTPFHRLPGYENWNPEDIPNPALGAGAYLEALAKAAAFANQQLKPEVTLRLTDDINGK